METNLPFDINYRSKVYKIYKISIKLLKHLILLYFDYFIIFLHDVLCLKLQNYLFKLFSYLKTRYN